MSETRYEIRWMSRDRTGYVWHCEPGQLTRKEAIAALWRMERRGIDGVAFEAGTSQMVMLDPEKRRGRRR